MRLIQIKGLTKSFGARVLFDSLDITLPDTGLFLVKGENGSGKTTLFNILSLMDRDYEGSLIVDGVDTSKLDEKEFRRFRSEHFAYVFQKDFFIDFDVVDEESAPLNSVVAKRGTRKRRTLSKGESEVLAIEEALDSDAPIILFDEVLRGLSIERRCEYLDVLKRAAENRLILLIAHDSMVESSVENVIQIKASKLELVKRKSVESLEPTSPSKKTCCHTHLSIKDAVRDGKRNLALHVIAVLLMVWIGMVGSVLSLYFRSDMAAMIEKYIAPAEGLVYDLKSTDQHLFEKYPDDVRLSLLQGFLFLDPEVPDDGTFHVRSTEASENGIRSFRYKGFQYNVPETIDDSLPDIWRVEANPGILNRLEGMGDFTCWRDVSINKNDLIVSSPGGSLWNAFNEIYPASEFSDSFDLEPGQMILSSNNWGDYFEPDHLVQSGVRIWIKAWDQQSDFSDDHSGDGDIGQVFPDGFDIIFSDELSDYQAVISDEDFSRLISAMTSSYAPVGQNVLITAENRRDVARSAASGRAELVYSSNYYLAFGDVVGWPSHTAVEKLKAPTLLGYDRVTQSELVLTDILFGIAIVCGGLFGVGYGICLTVSERKNSRLYRMRGESPAAVAAMYSLPAGCFLPIYGALAYLLCVVVAVFNLPDVFPVPSFINIMAILLPFIAFLGTAFLTVFILLRWKDRRRIKEKKTTR